MVGVALPWLAFVGLLVATWYLLGWHISQENFRKAVIGLAHKNVLVTAEMVIDLYLGANEKSRSQLSPSDIKRLESSFLWALAALARESESQHRVSGETLINLQELSSQLRSLKTDA